MDGRTLGVISSIGDRAQFFSSLPNSASRYPLTILQFAVTASDSGSSAHRSFRTTPSGFRYASVKTSQHLSHSQKCFTQCPPQLSLPTAAAFFLWSHDSHCPSENLKNFPPISQWNTIGHAGLAHFGSTRWCSAIP